MSNLVSQLLFLLANVVSIYTVVVVIRILLSWVPNLDPSNPLVQLLYQVTDPVLEPARRLIPPIGMIDISPMIVIVVLQVLANILQEMGTNF